MLRLGSDCSKCSWTLWFGNKFVLFVGGGVNLKTGGKVILFVSDWIAHSTAGLIKKFQLLILFRTALRKTNHVCPFKSLFVITEIRKKVPLFAIRRNVYSKGKGKVFRYRPE